MTKEMTLKPLLPVRLFGAKRGASARGGRTNRPFPLYEQRLPSGMSVWCQPRPDSTSVVALIAIRVGSRCEELADNGISHFLEHLVFTGTESWGEEEIKETITRRGGEWNGSTSAEDTMIYAHVSAEDLDIALEWLSQVVFHATLPEDKVDKERQVIFQERWGRYGWIINTLDTLGFGYELDRDVRRAIFPGSPLGLRIVGEDASLERTDRAALLDYYRRYYVPANAALVVVGNVMPKRAFDRARVHFGDLARRDPPRPPAPPRCADTQQRVVVRGPLPTDQVHLMIGARTVGRGHPDHWSFDVLAELLEQRLTEEMRYKRGLVYGLSAYNALFDDVGYFVIATNSERHRQQEILEAVETHLDHIRRGKVDPARVAEARAALKGRWALSMEDNLERAAWLAQWVPLSAANRPVPDYAALVDAVTARDLSRVVTTYFVPQRRYIGLHQPAITVAGGARILGVLAGMGVAAWLARRMWQQRSNNKSEMANHKCRSAPIAGDL
jgi:predicted Zn-dependent peptidase